MSNLIVVGFPKVDEAEAVRKELVAIQQEHLISLEDAVVVERDADGQVQLRQAVNLTAAGALGGGFWGSLVGLLFLNPLLGAAVGAGMGAASGALSDLGINDGFLRELGETLPKGSAALCLLVRDATPDRVVERLRSFAPHAKLLRTSLSHTDEAQLNELLENSRKQAEALRLG
ncbi:DUF1269 domain-containing protein [Synechococcus sp. Cruz-9H2]|jgi:uncharacterized membrane protein|uniref:DUF1269 domain-containing protein n=1 Tax=unclassified Synechococcus TaxID=2626047 RepID=UPI0020CDAE7F|nr:MULTISPECIES: DUF1269 domain-containing protein [unclassified Synechococcus]MCP9820838.1 DUF1269 domain-containing protein [Synechococcus sp. Cruz-9H2]MCP9845090.1 DUF1269 domain-containing protein [Synechococcus sp. Edmonson 11F2]MCP9857194.1 DUF1269 domain-containing protein [Synechococcus sp. Cruz-9C9]MCP9864479.1 DUF1269 domain-containing protein [Synechococcus sp. Cruz-7E5]MCP9871748.1 DUF1269 domain-containing protein [Synechococcus sp. Cruz-7B9]